MYNKKPLLGAMLALAPLAACQESAETDGAATNFVGGSASASGGADANRTVPSQTIADRISQSAEHTQLVSAIKAAGLMETMAGAGPYTVFAPSNAAFEKLPPGAAEGLMQPGSKAALTRILSYHVVPGVVTAQDLGAAIQRSGGKTELATVGGGTLTATQQESAILITDGRGAQTRVTQADLVQSNGVVHVVDGVLMPEGS